MSEFLVVDKGPRADTAIAIAIITTIITTTVRGFRAG